MMIGRTGECHTESGEASFSDLIGRKARVYGS